jgi:hypothetical protein
MMKAPLTPLVFVEGLPEPEGPKARRWLNEAARRAVAFTQDVHGEDDPFDAATVRVIAVSLWQTTEGQPQWGKLDLEHCLELANSIPLFRETIDGFILTTNTFYCFLNKFRLVPTCDAARVCDELAPSLEPILAHLLATHQQGREHDAMWN